LRKRKERELVTLSHQALLHESLQFEGEAKLITNYFRENLSENER